MSSSSAIIFAEKYFGSTKRMVPLFNIIISLCLILGAAFFEMFIKTDESYHLSLYWRILLILGYIGGVIALLASLAVYFSGKFLGLFQVLIILELITVFIGFIVGLVLSLSFCESYKNYLYYNMNWCLRSTRFGIATFSIVALFGLLSMIFSIHAERNRTGEGEYSNLST